ncbi:hypothetical protein OAG1_31810 [Agarivorans sp. OAG1]|uniref:hypothetical protein n=1 Tax=Agarivorans sp. OAG1 TaxID=3082387 RepID=UPI002B2D2596|nr:hypothetical protein OAG1_31810 [Agarivorans sp. OAG1]
MRNVSVDASLQQMLKKVLLVVIGSGLISNALYIYGLAYYQGYIGRLGFEYNFFPIDWNDTLLWTYFASRELGASTIGIWTTLTEKAVLVLFLAVYMLARIWMSINEMGGSANKRKGSNNLWFSRLLVRIRRSHPKKFKIFYPPLKWFLIKEHSLWAFVASYFFLIAILFIPIFIFIWVYFPMFGVSHGESIAGKRLSSYEETLCGDSEDYWSQCIDFPTDHIKGNNIPKLIKGRLIAKNGALIGVLTDKGPVTMSMSKHHFGKTVKNPCYEGECTKKEGSHNKSSQMDAEKPDASA